MHKNNSLLIEKHMIYPNSPGNNYKYSLHKKAMRLTALKQKIERNKFPQKKRELDVDLILPGW
jgi:hypothetical protein